VKRRERKKECGNKGASNFLAKVTPMSACFSICLSVCLSLSFSLLSCFCVSPSVCWLFCMRCSLELHRTLIMTGSPAIIDTQTLPSHQLALPPPEVTSPEPPVSQAAVSPGPVHLATAAPPPQRAVAFSQLHSHSLAPASGVPSAYHQTQFQLASQNVQPSPVLSVLAYDATSGTFFDPRSGLATKIKGGLTLASLGKLSNKFSPY